MQYTAYRNVAACLAFLLVELAVEVSIGDEVLRGTQRTNVDEERERPRKLTVKANCVYEIYRAERTIDGNRGTMWNGRGKSPQWIEFDLGCQCQLRHAVLYGEGSPNEKTHHEVWLSAKPMANELDGANKLVQLRHSPEERGKYAIKFKDRPIGRYLQIRTINSWWAEWYEIEIFATELGGTRRTSVDEERESPHKPAVKANCVYEIYRAERTIDGNRGRCGTVAARRLQKHRSRYRTRVSRCHP